MRLAAHRGMPDDVAFRSSEAWKMEEESVLSRSTRSLMYNNFVLKETITTTTKKSRILWFARAAPTLLCVNERLRGGRETVWSTESNDRQSKREGQGRLVVIVQRLVSSEWRFAKADQGKKWEKKSRCWSAADIWQMARWGRGFEASRGRPGWHGGEGQKRPLRGRIARTGAPATRA